MQYMILVWLTSIVIFGVLEALNAGLVSIWFVPGGIAALLCAMLGSSVGVQVVAFIAVSALALALTRPLAKRWLNRPANRTNADRVLDQQGRVTEEVDNDNATGAVYVDGKTWSARSANGSKIPAGKQVAIVKMEGVKLFVEEL